MFTEFFLDDLQIDEPIGWDTINVKINRETDWHGIVFEASLGTLGFYGTAADYLIDKKTSLGLKADVTFTAKQSCGVYEETEELIRGKLDFGQWNKTCGRECIVSIPVEQVGCVMKMRNRYDQKVDMDSEVAFDGMTAITKYDKLGEEILLLAKELEVLTKGTVETGGESTAWDQLNIGTEQVIMFRPTYTNQIKNSINRGQLIPDSPEGWIKNNDGTTYIDISPALLFDDVVSCFSGPFQYNFRLKGSFDIDALGTLTEATIKLKVVSWNGSGTNIYQDATVLHEVLLADEVDVTSLYADSFDETFSGSRSLLDSEGLYAFLEFFVDGIGVRTMINVTFDEETSVEISNTKSCPPTTAKVYAINESLSHVVEAITDGCLKVKSDYYGRYDSEPYASENDGCGSLRVISNGLNIRKAEDAKYFLSLKELFEGLRPIDNIGMGVEPNEDAPLVDWLRIESVDYFYKDAEILRHPLVPDMKFDVEENKHYSLIKIGYEKWEAEDVNGLDEMNSNKEYRTGLSSVNNTLNLLSKFIAGSYPLERTRQQSFADSGGADTKYDNETFIICVDRDGYGVFQVEQGNIDSPANFFSPATTYNWRIRPYYNLMRWFKSIGNSYANIDDSDNLLFFVSGTGNIKAEGELAETVYIAAGCKLENGVKAENDNLGKLDFADQAKAKPLWRPETVTYSYPMSVADYKTLKANPYGYISSQCGTGEWLKGFVQNINYKLSEGKAEFTLELKWN